MVVSTYQAASGAGAAAMEELELQTREVLEGKRPTCNIFKQQYAFNLFSHNAPVLSNGYNEEEMKLVKETRKIWPMDTPSSSAPKNVSDHSRPLAVVSPVAIATLRDLVATVVSNVRQEQDDSVLEFFDDTRASPLVNKADNPGVLCFPDPPQGTFNRFEAGNSFKRFHPTCFDDQLPRVEARPVHIVSTFGLNRTRRSPLNDVGTFWLNAIRRVNGICRANAIRRSRVIAALWEKCRRLADDLPIHYGNRLKLEFAVFLFQASLLWDGFVVDVDVGVWDCDVAAAAAAIEAESHAVGGAHERVWAYVASGENPNIYTVGAEDSFTAEVHRASEENPNSYNTRAGERVIVEARRASEENPMSYYIGADNRVPAEARQAEGHEPAEVRGNHGGSCFKYLAYSAGLFAAVSFSIYVIMKDLKPAEATFESSASCAWDEPLKFGSKFFIRFVPKS